MRKLSSLSSRVVPELQSVPEKIHITTIPSKQCSLNSRENTRLVRKKINTPEAVVAGESECKESDCDSISVSEAPVLKCKSKFKSVPVDHKYLAEILSRKDWYMLLNHERKAQRVFLNVQTVVSILQTQENPLCSLRFCLWASNICASFAKDKWIRGALSNALYRKGPILLSTELVQDIKDSGCQITEDFLCVLIGSWGRLGLAKYCAQVFEQVSYLGLSLTTRLYNAVIDALVKSNSLDLAYLKFQQMGMDSCVPDKFTYNILIHGVCKAGVMDEALRLVKQMEVLRYAPNVFTYTILIDGYCNAGRVDEAFRVLERMKSRNLSPNDATYRSLVNGVFRALSNNEAFERLSRWVNQESNLPKVAYDSILYLLSKSSLAKNAAVFLGVATERGYVPDNMTFNIAITCLIKGLQLEETCMIFDAFVRRGVKVDLCTCLMLIENLYNSGRDCKGNQYLSWMLEERLVDNVIAFNMVIDCFCKSKMMNKAIDTLRDMSKRGVHPDLVTFNTLIAGYCKIRDLVKVQELLLMLLDHGFVPDVFTFSSIIDSLCKSNQIVDAFDCFAEMIEWGLTPTSFTYNSLIRSLCFSGDVFKARKLLRKMQVNGIQPDIYSFNALIQKYCKMNELHKAQRLLTSMRNLDLYPDNFTYIAFINALCESGRSQEAKELFSLMEENSCKPDAFTCNACIDAFLKSCRFEEARDIWLECKAKGRILKEIPF